MEGIQTIQALKAVQSSLPAQTTIPSSELVMLYAADGTPIAKIARDDLVKAVASVMASNSQNTFSKLLGVQANGTPMGIGASDLASVLGALCYKGTANNTMDANALPNGYWSCYNENRPTNTPYIGNGGIICFRADDVVLQIAFDKNTQKTFYRMEAYDAWTAWHEYTYDMPSFYKDYANLSSLASALGVMTKISNGYNLDANNVTTTSITIMNTRDDYADYHWGISGGCLVTIVYSADYIMQIMFDPISANLVIRGKWPSAGWRNWHTISVN